jgi:diacylglycerol O-acyltransferase / wax synthase
MRYQRNHDVLSGSDAAFLYLEREGVPMHIAGVSELEGVVLLEACRRFVESKIPRIPRYRQRLVMPPFNLGLPRWEFDPNFDVCNHVREISLEKGTESEYKVVSAKILGDLMDRRRPLWDITLVRGLKGNRTGFITRVHHCLGDGIAGVGLMNAVLDAQPAVLPQSKKRPRFRVPPHRNPEGSLLEGWTSLYANLVEQYRTAQADALRITEGITGGFQVPSADKLARLLPELAAPTQPLHFNVTCRGPQKIAWFQVPLADMKAIKEACGCSVNDVALALLIAAIRPYASLHGDRIKGRLLRIMVPVSLRNSGNNNGLGNRVSMIPVTVPLDIRNPRELLAAVHERTEFLKSAHVAEMISLAGGLFATLPASMQALAGPLVSQLPVAPFNLVCTNVPGPTFPLYLMNHKMLTWHPYVPIGGDMAVNCAIVSYNGMVYFGFTGDANAAPDLVRLEKFLKSSVQELKKASGIRPSRKKAVRPKPAVAPAAAGTKTVRIALPVPEAPSVAVPGPEPTRAAEPGKGLASEVA